MTSKNGSPSKGLYSPHPLIGTENTCFLAGEVGLATELRQIAQRPASIERGERSLLLFA